MDSDSSASDGIEKVYAWWACVLTLQIMVLTWCTGRCRMATKTIHSEEDKMWLDDPDNVVLHPDGGGHEALDRIRAAHLHDLKMIILFFVVVFLWLTTSPNYFMVTTIIRLFSMCKILDTVIFMGFLKAAPLMTIIPQIACYGTLAFICVDLCWCFI